MCFFARISGFVSAFLWIPGNAAVVRCRGSVGQYRMCAALSWCRVDSVSVKIDGYAAFKLIYRFELTPDKGNFCSKFLDFQTIFQINYETLNLFIVFV